MKPRTKFWLNITMLGSVLLPSTLWAQQPKLGDFIQGLKSLKAQVQNSDSGNDPSSKQASAGNSGVAATGNNSLQASKRPIRDCISDVDSEQTVRLASLAIRQRNLDMKKSSADVLKDAEADVEGLCNSLLIKEGKSLRESKGSSDYSNYCLATTADKAVAVEKYYNQAGNYAANKAAIDPLIAMCRSELTAQDMVTYNKKWSQRYQDHLHTEQVATAEQETMDKGDQALEAAKQTVRNFDIKGLSLKTTKQQLLAIGGSGTWKCIEDNNDPETDVCNFALAPKSCWKQQLVHPLTGEGRVNALGQPIMLDHCEKTFRELDTIPAGAKRLATLGGSRVENIIVGFSRGEVIQIAFELEKNSLELKAGLTERYGTASTKTPTDTEWVGKDEVLAVSSDVITLRRPSALVAREERIKKRNAAIQAQAEAKQKAVSDQRRKDL